MGKPLGQFFSPAVLVDFMERSMHDAAKSGLVLRTSTGVSYAGRTVELEHQPMLNFGGCSYLGLEQRPELREAAIEATRRYGTQFPFPRAYLECALYPRLEHALGQMTGGQVLVASSTTAAHLSALPVLVGERDAVVIDKHAHASLHTAVALLHGIPVRTVPHGREDLAEATIAELSTLHRHVWYVLDGLYSMSGEFAPFAELSRLLATYPQLHLYVDDAHATSWTGQHGHGRALDELPDRSRVVVALSLNKAFSAAGGALVFPTEALRTRVRRCGGPMIFSGPIQPPMLGAAVASAELHLTAEHATLCAALVERIRYLRAQAPLRGVALANTAETPIVSVQCGSPARAFQVVRALWSKGIYASPAVPPAVPPELAGLRVTVSVLNTHEDIDALLGVLSVELARLDTV